VGETDFPFANTRAARMLREALDRIKRLRGISVRTLGKQLGYKQATVLSHMASGRVAIPLERAPDIARAADLSPGDFLAACVEQRSAEAATLLQYQPANEDETSFGLVSELNVIAGQALDSLNEEQKSVMRKVAADARPGRRWLSEAELPIVEGLRRLRPEITEIGLTPSDRAKLEAALRQM
jgi:hypothetical protein